MEKNNLLFIFDHERDFWRANVVRNAWINKGGQAEGFWEILPPDKEVIDACIKKSCATVVLISHRTSDMDFARYAICQSRKQGKPVVGIYIHNIKDQHGQRDKIGCARFGEIDKDEKGESLFFWQLYPVYRWVIDDGVSNLSAWIDTSLSKPPTNLSRTSSADLSLHST